MIQLLCPNCSALLQVPENSVGQQARCPRCSTISPIPTPGDVHRRQHCQDCGHDADYTAQGQCPSCGQSRWLPWCARHERQLAGPVCARCVEEHNQALREPTPSIGLEDTTGGAARPPEPSPFDSVKWEGTGPLPPPPPPPGASPAEPDYYRPPQAETYPPYTPLPPGYPSPSSGTATAAMICGIAGLVSSCLCACISVPLSGVAIGLAFQANAEINKGLLSPSEKSKVITAWICGGIGLALAAIGMIAGIAIQVAEGNLP